MRLTHALASLAGLLCTLYPSNALKACVNEELGCAQVGSPFCTRKDSYTGDKATTVSGKPCQSWGAQSPHAHGYTEVDAGAVCRNPDGDAAPWCYVDDPNVRWEYCFKACEPCHDAAKGCANLGSLACRLESEYSGSANLTRSKRCRRGDEESECGRRPCQRWQSQSPNIHRWRGLPENFGRNPNRRDGPWCFIADEETKGQRWDYVLDHCSGCTCRERTEYGQDADFGEIFSPQRQDQYCNNLDCRHVFLQGRKGENLALTLHYLETESQADYLEVSFVKKDAMFPGVEERTLFKRLSGHQPTQTWIFADDGQVELLFHTDDDTTRRGFHLSYYRYPKAERPCDCPLTFLTVDSPQAVSIRNPQYEESRACSRMKCQFYLQAKNTSESVEMTFIRLDLGSNNYSTHNIFIHEGNQSLPSFRVKVLNESTPTNWAYTSAGAVVLLEYERRNQSEAAGFVATVAQKPGPCKCWEKRLNSAEGSLVSPGFPDTFCPHMNCTTVVEIPDASALQLDFEELDLPNNGRLSLITDANNATHPLAFFDTRAARMAQQPFTVDGNRATFTFASEGFVLRPGFKLNYKALQRASDCRCPPVSSEVLSAAEGTIEAAACGPLDCLFYLPPKENTNRIHVWLEQLEIAPNSTENYLSILNRGFRHRQPQPVAALTYDAHRRQSDQRTLHVSREGALVHFHTQEAFDGEEMRSGFRLRFRWDLRDCGSGIRNVEAGAKGNLSSPNFPRSYDSNLRCLWRFRAPEGYAVRVRVESINTEECCDHLRIFDGPDTSEGSRRATLKGTDLGRSLVANGTELLVQFTSDGSVQRGGWNISYEVVPSNGTGGPVRATCGEQAEHLLSLRRYLFLMKLYQSQAAMDEDGRKVLAENFLAGEELGDQLKRPADRPKSIVGSEKACPAPNTARFGAERSQTLAAIQSLQSQMEVDSSDMAEELMELKRRYTAQSKLSRTSDETEEEYGEDEEEIGPPPPAPNPPPPTLVIPVDAPVDE